MKQTLMTILFFLFFAGTVSATPLLLDDYVGRGDHSRTNGRDVIGNYRFDIFSLSLDHTGSSVAIDIDTNYNGTNGGNVFKTEMGDFFISTDAYTPFGASPYYGDNFSNGEDWEYAFVFDNHDIYGPGRVSGGYFSLYQISSGDIILSDQFHPNHSGIRKNQEVRVDVSNLTAIVNGGSWEVNNSGLHLNISNIFFNDFDFGAVRWQMTCANDVIEASIPIPNPEPATMLLFGLGLLGFAGVNRRKNRAFISRTITDD